MPYSVPILPPISVLVIILLPWGLYSSTTFAPYAPWLLYDASCTTFTKYSVTRKKDKRSIEDSDDYETMLATWNQGNGGFDWLLCSDEWCIKLQSAQWDDEKVITTF